jgi:hypothetical protein
VSFKLVRGDTSWYGDTPPSVLLDDAVGDEAWLVWDEETNLPVAGCTEKKWAARIVEALNGAS